MVNVLEGERNDTTQDLCNTKTHVPKGKSRSLFTTCIILTTQQHQGWAYGCLKDTEEDSCDQQAAVVAGTSRGSRSDTPEEDVSS